MQSAMFVYQSDKGSYGIGFNSETRSLQQVTIVTSPEMQVDCQPIYGGGLAVLITDAVTSSENETITSDLDSEPDYDADTDISSDTMDTDYPYDTEQQTVEIKPIETSLPKPDLTSLQSCDPDSEISDCDYDDNESNMDVDEDSDILDLSTEIPTLSPEYHSNKPSNHSSCEDEEWLDDLLDGPMPEIPEEFTFEHLNDLIFGQPEPRND